MGITWGCLPSAIGLAVTIAAAPVSAQTTLSISEAVDRALAGRPALKAEAERVAAAEARIRQAGAWSNPEVQFTNENLRRGQSYTNDVDTLAVVTQPLDVLGKRGWRVDVAKKTALRTAAESAVAGRDVARDVKLAYWTARGAQEQRDLLKRSVENFQRIVDFHQAQLRVGAIPEQDVLRVRLEQEQRQLAVHMAEVAESAARTALGRAIGVPLDPSVVLSEPLYGTRTPTPGPTSERPEVRLSKAALDEAVATASLQRANARPDVGLILGFKRTLLPDSTGGVNTAVAGLHMTVPVFDRNTGNRLAAEADARRQQHLLEAAELDVRAEADHARMEYDLRRAEVASTLTPLREHAASLAAIARAAYEQGAVDVLRLLDAERAHLEAERVWVDGMVAYQQSVVTFEFAQGAVR